jgi:hypothetical protein
MKYISAIDSDSKKTDYSYISCLTLKTGTCKQYFYLNQRMGLCSTDFHTSLNEISIPIDFTKYLRF